MESFSRWWWALSSLLGGPAGDMRIWQPEETKAIRELVAENNLQGAESDIEMWIDCLMGDGATFESALAQAELMFSE